jgi:hypothetical protein
MFVWRANLDVEERLRVVFEAYSLRIQDFFSKALGTRWPASDANPHVIIGPSRIEVWWGSGDQPGAADVRIEPIFRYELNV